jgi:hypothetical protein
MIMITILLAYITLLTHLTNLWCQLYQTPKPSFAKLEMQWMHPPPPIEKPHKVTLLMLQINGKSESIKNIFAGHSTVLQIPAVNLPARNPDTCTLITDRTVTQMFHMLSHYSLFPLDFINRTSRSYRFFFSAGIFTFRLLVTFTLSRHM